MWRKAGRYLGLRGSRVARGIELPGSGWSDAMTSSTAAPRSVSQPGTFRLTDLTLDLSGVPESKPALQKIGISLAGLITNTYSPRDALAEDHFGKDEEYLPPAETDDEFDETPEEVRTVEKYIIAIGFDVFGAMRGVVVPLGRRLELASPVPAWDRSWHRGQPMGIAPCLGH